MKPFDHARHSVKKWGGKPEDYLPIHDFIDCSKAAHPDMRHRAILHNALGCFIVERVFGHNLTNSEGRLVSTRDVAEQHILDDMGFIPTISDYLKDMPMYDWLGGPKRTRKVTYHEGLADPELLVAPKREPIPQTGPGLIDTSMLVD